MGWESSIKVRKNLVHFLIPAFLSFSAKFEAVLCVLRSNWGRMLANGKKSFHLTSKDGTREQGFSYDLKSVIKLPFPFMGLLQNMIS